jgi:hypothetical protein
MKIVTLPFRNSDAPGSEAERGVQISRWLKEQGVIMGRDYTWRLDQNNRELQFMFNGDAEAWATLITMRDL